MGKKKPNKVLDIKDCLTILNQYKAELKTQHFQVLHQALLFQESTVVKSMAAQSVNLDLDLSSITQKQSHSDFASLKHFPHCKMDIINIPISQSCFKD